MHISLLKPTISLPKSSIPLPESSIFVPKSSMPCLTLARPDEAGMLGDSAFGAVQLFHQELHHVTVLPGAWHCHVPYLRCYTIIIY